MKSLYSSIHWLATPRHDDSKTTCWIKKSLIEPEKNEVGDITHKARHHVPMVRNPRTDEKKSYQYLLVWEGWFIRLYVSNKPLSISRENNKDSSQNSSQEEITKVPKKNISKAVHTQLSWFKVSAHDWTGK